MHQGGVAIADGTQCFPHETGDVCLTTLQRSVPMGSASTLSVHEPLAFEAMQNRQHCRVGVAGEIVRHLPAGELRVETGPRISMTRRSRSPSRIPVSPCPPWFRVTVSPLALSFYTAWYYLA